jgi:hypothetical protein
MSKRWRRTASVGGGAAAPSPPPPPAAVNITDAGALDPSHIIFNFDGPLSADVTDPTGWHDAEAQEVMGIAGGAGNSFAVAEVPDSSIGGFVGYAGGGATAGIVNPGEVPINI